MKLALQTKFGSHKIKVEDLKKYAAEIIEKRHAQDPGDPIKLDRDAIRSKDCLICWFCENCPELIDLWVDDAQPTGTDPQDSGLESDFRSRDDEWNPLGTY
jgi:hypothetical protein